MGIFSGLFRSRDAPTNSTAGSAYRFFMGGSTAEKYDGGVEVAHELAQKYVAEYPRRTALIDELKRF